MDVSFSCVPVIDHEFRHNIVKVAVDPRGDSRLGRKGRKGEAHVLSESTKKQVRGATLTDSTGSIPMSILGEHITSVMEGEF